MTKCKHCGNEIVKFGKLWIDSTLVFPQYCPTTTTGPSSFHEPKDFEVGDECPNCISTKHNGVVFENGLTQTCFVCNDLGVLDEKGVQILNTFRVFG